VLEGSKKPRRFRAVIEYDGSAYHGFQRQLELPTVQAEVEQAITRFSGQDATVLGAGRTDSGVHACGQVIAFDYSAKRRSYRYQIWNGSTRSPLRHSRSWHVARPLSLARMNEAAAVIRGVHDFATFGQPTSGQSTVRHVFAAQWRAEGEMTIFEIEANAFLYRMVRSLVGSMKAVGEGAWSVEQFRSALEAADRDSAGQTAPAHALFLVSVRYDE
jgi:tRNA pseudouridine38-40 synthase